jgi:hypothetical protein
MMDSCSNNRQLEDDETARSSTPATTVSSTASCTQVIITELQTNDVIMGRGAGMIHNMGNVRYRELVATRKKEYVRAERNHKKQTIAKQILAEIAHRNGRFVRKVETPEEAKALGIPEGTQAWVLASSDVVLEKVKQALREKSPHDEEDCQSTTPHDKTRVRLSVRHLPMQETIQLLCTMGPHFWLCKTLCAPFIKWPLLERSSNWKKNTSAKCS